MKVLYLITARGGSKGVPKKNIKKIGGIPLIAYKIISAKKCKYEGRIVVSTEDEEIARIAKEYGAEVPFMRPDSLATDTASSIDVVLHAVEWIEKNDKQVYDYIFLLEPSSPFATYKDFENALELIESKKAKTVLSVVQNEINTCFIKELDNKGTMTFFYEEIIKLSKIRRQDFKDQYTMNGCIYISRWDYFKQNKMFHSDNTYPYVMESKTSIEIDTWDDYEYANYLVQKNKIDLNFWK